MLPAAHLLRTAAACGHGAQARGLHHSAGAAQGLLGKLFGRAKPKDDGDKDTPAAPADAAPETGTEPEKYQAHVLGTTTQTVFKPKFPIRTISPERLEQRLRRVLRESDVALASPDWKATSIAERETKFKVLSGVIQKMRLPVSNRVLHNVQTAGDLLAELSVKPPAKDAGHPVAQFYATKTDELPANMRFEPFAKGTRRLHAHQ
ncbi:hypothetical protein IWQ57_002986 [Coemansia nantahalensis]|uniref:54S ribosomal protein L50, mitochondrial n=2 Tax=Coemansia TaxID=4863 RepID=A0ACC1L9Q0_9FUNG|nr:hypothetical protein IWQ57_002986 [Coemansia nantahalensis]KAJ2803235.1 54S ribosomal protein L50, mitochondrial [Coemansia helicoidea]